MVFYGEGGFSVTDVIEMPVNLRSYYYAKLADIMAAREQAMKDAKNKNSGKGRKW